MKKTIIALSIITGGIIACSPKVTGIASAASVEAGGKLISSAKCTRCHDDETHHVPRHTFEEQERVMQVMAKKAKLTPEETADLLAYVKTNAKKN